jgi:hypothetical protein
LPIGFSPGKNFFAADSLTITTGGALMSSVSAKVRPASKGMCKVEKYDGVTES